MKEYRVTKSIVPVTLSNPSERQSRAKGRKTLDVLLNLDTGNQGHTMLRLSDIDALQLPQLRRVTAVRSVHNDVEEIPLFGPVEVYFRATRTSPARRLRIPAVAGVTDDRPRLMGEADIVRAGIVLALDKAAVLRPTRSRKPRHPSGAAVRTYAVDPLAV